MGQYPGRIVIVFLLLNLSACGTYRTGSGEYRGGGGYKTPSEYSKGVDSSDYTREEEQGPRDRLRGGQKYLPGAPFHLSCPVTVMHINRGFKSATDPKHTGLDLGGKSNMPIFAAHEGVVIYAGNGFSGYGNMVLVEYDREWATLYGHLENILVRQGATVKPGDLLGGMGSTGHATGVHLHFEVMHNREPVDPVPLLTRPSQFAHRQASKRLRKHVLK